REHRREQAPLYRAWVVLPRPNSHRHVAYQVDGQPLAHAACCTGITQYTSGHGEPSERPWPVMTGHQETAFPLRCHLLTGHCPLSWPLTDRSNVRTNGRMTGHDRIACGSWPTPSAGAA